MGKIIPTNSQFSVSSTKVLKVDRVLKNMNSLTDLGRHAADNLDVSDFVDLTDEEYRCFVCDDTILYPVHSLATAVTKTSRTYIAAKIGQLVGKNFIVIISEDDDYICQNCFNLINRLDSSESELMNLKTCLLKNLEHTYLNEKKAANTLESLMQGEQGNADQPPRKKRCFATKSVLKSVQKQNCNSLNKCTEKSQFDGNAAITDKENSISHGKSTKSTCLPEIGGYVNVAAQLLSNQSVNQTLNFVKVESQHDVIVNDQSIAIFDTETNAYGNIKAKSNSVHQAAALDLKNDLLLSIVDTIKQSPQTMILPTNEGNLEVTPVQNLTN